MHTPLGTVLGDEGAPLVVLVSWEELAEVRRLRDQADITEADHRKAADGPVVTHEAFVAELEAEDAQAAAP
ncbi:hypothetical protein ACH4VS_37745 [Streptomyces hygroscopicus]|uniref:hypothetical protein n=1 Tax=Streptomyces hygroscopicus TaxID=1912 RepID=UPI00117D719A|nr:hypothetical protein [Streptomyces hygroscopicus]GLV79329.1 hypothetical protein Shyhy02_73290 [Streptomyces hygroscopicus subsp. hygroscopicus]